MSEYTTRSRVRAVSVAPQIENSAPGVAATGAVLAGAAIVALLRAAGQAWASTRTTESTGISAAGSSGTVQAPATLRSRFSEEERLAAATLLSNHTPADALKLATLQALECTPFQAHASNLKAPAAALAAAQTVNEVERARAALLGAIEKDHLGFFVQHLTQAAATASREAGFEGVEVKHDAIDSATRIIATDAAGRSLISEVSLDATGEISLATEAVGIIDGSCHTALDRFDAALERLGVRSASPCRTTTGGVCELAFARQELPAILRNRAHAGTPTNPEPRLSEPRDTSRELSRRRTLNSSLPRIRSKS